MPEFFCPLSGMIMENPVIIPSLNDITYEASIIVDWIKHNKSPIKKPPNPWLDSFDFEIPPWYHKPNINEKVPNRAIKSRIEAFLTEYPQYKSEQFDSELYKLLCNALILPDKQRLLDLLENNFSFVCRNLYLGDNIFHYSFKQKTSQILFDFILEFLDSKRDASWASSVNTFKNCDKKTALELLQCENTLKYSPNASDEILRVEIQNQNIKAVKYFARLASRKLAAQGAFLWSAIEINNAEIVQVLIKNRANVNAFVEYESILLKACAKLSSAQIPGTTSARIGIIKILLENGAVEPPGSAPILYTAIALKKKQLVDVICKNHTKLNINEVCSGSKTPLAAAVEVGDLQIVTNLLASGANVNTPFHVYTSFLTRNLVTALNVAIEKQAVNIVRKLARCADVDKCFQDSKGNSYLHWAVINTNQKILELLLSLGFPSHLVDKAQQTPKSLAKKLGHYSLALAIRSHSISQLNEELFGAKVKEAVETALVGLRKEKEDSEAKLRRELQNTNLRINSLNFQLTSVKELLEASQKECAQLKSSIPAITRQLNQLTSLVNTTIPKTNNSLEAVDPRPQVPSITIVAEPRNIQPHKTASGQLSPRANRVFSQYRKTNKHFKKAVLDAPHACTMTFGITNDTILIYLLKHCRQKRTLTNDDIAKIRLVLSCGAQWDYVNSEGVTASQFYPREIFNQSPVCNK